MARIINMARAARPRVSERQRELCKELVSLGLARMAITAAMLGKSINDLTPADLNAGHSTIKSVSKEIGHTITDARFARSPLMQRLVREAASRVRMRIRIA